jgi:hypothetical protein
MDLQTFTTQWATDSIALPESNHTHLRPAKQEYRLRPSRLGVHAYITAYEYLLHLHFKDAPVCNEPTVYGRRQDIFTTGHEVEARLVNLMRAVGMHFESQVPTTFVLEGFTIEGTADMLIDDTVVDIKTASSSNFKRLLSGYNDLTYRTQLALYAHGLQVDNVGLLLYNKDTSELAWKPIQLTLELQRVKDILHLLNSLRKEYEVHGLPQAVEYVIDNFTEPVPVAQMSNKVPTGKYLVPKELMFNPLVRDLLMHTEEVDGTRYVTYMCSTDEIVDNIVLLNS